MRVTSGRTLAVGITGGIGGGKSGVARVFRSQGAVVLLADPIAKELMRSRPDLRRRIRTAFGPSVYDRNGRLRRKRLAELIFADERKKNTLNAIVHPAVIKEIRLRIRREKRRGTVPMVVVEAALIYEAHTEDLFDYVVAVDASRPERVKRIMRRDGLSRTEAGRRIGAQLSARTKAARADFRIRNSGDPQALARKARTLYRLLTRLSVHPGTGGHR